MITETIINIGLLWFAHIIGDMALQSDFIAHTKAKFWYSMFTHVYTWTVTISIALWFLGLFTWMKFAFLFSGHLVVDRWKSRQPKDEEHMWCILVDQGIHLFQIIICGVF